MDSLILATETLFTPDGDFAPRDYVFFLAELVAITCIGVAAFIFAFISRFGSKTFTTSAQTKLSAAGFFVGTALTKTVNAYSVLKQEPTINTGDNAGPVGWTILTTHSIQAVFAVLLLAWLIRDVAHSFKDE